MLTAKEARDLVPDNIAILVEQSIAEMTNELVLVAAAVIKERAERNVNSVRLSTIASSLPFGPVGAALWGKRASIYSPNVADWRGLTDIQRTAANNLMELLIEAGYEVIERYEGLPPSIDMDYIITWSN